MSVRCLPHPITCACLHGQVGLWRHLAGDLCMVAELEWTGTTLTTLDLTITCPTSHGTPRGGAPAELGSPDHRARGQR